MKHNIYTACWHPLLHTLTVSNCTQRGRFHFPSLSTECIVKEREAHDIRYKILRGTRGNSVSSWTRQINSQVKVFKTVWTFFFLRIQEFLSAVVVLFHQMKQLQKVDVGHKTDCISGL
ncbi:hypothetical protein V1264_002095 [Littorina saxatilis]|uniref:Uncharacterized protein n=1 Tax=Littorina saxatilis TaxID=31220 RepID=A0AAN9C4C6_9CAEN